MFKNKIKKILSTGLALTMIASTLIPANIFATSSKVEEANPDKETSLTITGYHFYATSTPDEKFENGPHKGNPYIVPWFWSDAYAESAKWESGQPVELESYRSDKNNVTYCLDLGKAMPNGTTMNYRPEKITKQLNRVVMNGYPNMKGEAYGVSDQALEWATAVALKIVDGHMYTASGEQRPSDLNLEAFTNGNIEYTVTKERYPNLSDAQIARYQAEANKVLEVVKKLVNTAKDESIIVDELHMNKVSDYVIPAGSQEFKAGPFNVSLTSANAKDAHLEVKVEGAENTVFVDESGKELKAKDLQFGENFYVKGTTTNNLTLKVTAYAAGIETPIQYYYATDEKGTAPGPDGKPIAVDYQRMYVSQNVTLQDETIVNVTYTPAFYVTLTKTDLNSKTAVPGAVVEVKDSHGQPVNGSPFTTDDEGKIVIPNLIVGSYTYAEVKAPDGYKLDTTVHSFEVTAEGTIAGTTTFTNEANKVVITKTDLVNGDPVPGAVISVTDANGKEIKGSPFTTNDKGEIVLEKLPAGTYTFRETVAPDGYILNTEEISFTVKEDGTVEGKTTLTNKPLNVVISKTDDATKAPVAGAEINVFNDKGEKIPGSPFTSDENGQFVLNKLVAGTYTFKEIAAPAGYILNSETFTFEVDAEGNVTGTTTFTNKQNNTVITKTDMVTGAPVPGATIEVKNEKGEPINGSPFVTDEKGEISISKLPAGEYTFRETIAPDGYILNQEEAKFIVHADGSIEGTVVLKNAPTKVEITKKSSTSGELLANAFIQIMDKDGKVVRQGKTDKEGKFVVYNLPVGEYTFQETKAPNGFVLDNTIRKFTIKEDGSVVGNTTIMNNPTLIVVSKVDANTGKGLENALLEIRDANGNKVIEGRTGKDGKLAISKLNVGTYTLVEKEAPYGYALNSTPVEFTVHEDGTITGLTKIEDKQLEVVLEKVDEKGKGLENATFEVRYGNTIKCQVTTNKDGKVVLNNLEPGDYTFKEIKAPNGYALDGRSYSFTVHVDGTVTGTTKIVNKQIVVSLYKKDLTTGETLAGATFVVKNESGKVVAEGVTDKDGKLVIEGLAAGKYTLEETKAPEGYQLNKTIYTFIINPDGTVEGDTTIYNKKLPVNPDKPNETTPTEPGKPENPTNEEVQTGDNSSNMMVKVGMIALAAVAAIVGVGVLAKKKKED